MAAADPRSLAAISGGLAVDSRGLASLKAAAGKAPDKALKQAAREFEALFLNQVLKSLRESLPKDGPFSSSATETYTQMLDRELSRSMAAKGTGLAALIEKQLGVAMTAKDGKIPLPAANATGTAARTSAAGAALPVSSVVPAARPASANSATAASAETQRSFLSKVVDLARGPASAVGLSPVFVAAQAALESGWGRHEIRGADGESAHNLFSIKAGANWSGPTVDVATTEVENGVSIRKVEKFRAYASYAEGLADYVNLLASNNRYRQALASGGDAQAFASAIGRSGYATDPAYGRKLAALIEKARALTGPVV